jgi:hypothetical protein
LVTTVRILATTVLPLALQVPKLPLRQMTAWRKARSATLFVGSMPSSRTNGKSAWPR